MFHDDLGFRGTLSISRHPGERHPEWYADNREVEGEMTFEQARWLCEGADAVLSFETWYGDVVPRVACELGVKTVLVPMYECCPLDAAELRLTDAAICPTLLDLEEAQRTPGLADAEKQYLPVPCDTSRIAFRQRHRARTFVHHSGHGGLGGRNGTANVIAAWRYVRSPARLIVRHQSPLGVAVPDDPRIVVDHATPADYWQLWSGEGDVYLHPTRWDALSLPIQEALTAGMPVMTTNFWPHCDRGDRRGYLPASSQALAIAVERTMRQRICREFTSYETTPQAIAAAVDAIYDTDIRAASRDARAWAEERSWARLGSAWRKALLSPAGVLFDSPGCSAAEPWVDGANKNRSRERA